MMQKQPCCDHVIARGHRLRTGVKPEEMNIGSRSMRPQTGERDRTRTAVTSGDLDGQSLAPRSPSQVNRQVSTTGCDVKHAQRCC
jgi:hypothetical protein